MREFRPLARTKLVREEVDLRGEDMGWVRFASPFIAHPLLPITSNSNQSYIYKCVTFCLCAWLAEPISPPPHGRECPFERTKPVHLPLRRRRRDWSISIFISPFNGLA